MSSYSRITVSLNWRALVAEAIDRRKAEKLTQREHAALAGVSIPTIVAFDRGEITLTLAKAFDILRVVGLLDEPSGEGAQELFVRDAFARWRDLVSALPERSAGRFPNGWYRIDYALEGDLKEVPLHRFEDVLAQAVTRHSGWPPFWVPTRAEIAPKERDGVIECWLAPEEHGTSRANADPAHCDFWRASPDGRMFLIRGYQEDGQETFPAGAIFDSGLPVWRLGETLLHAARLASLLKRSEDSEIKIRFRAHYTGLSGRVLKAWANPLTDLMVEGAPARSDEATLEVEAAASDVEANLTTYVYPMVASLYERFGVTGLSANGVKRVVDDLQRSRIA